MSGGTDLTKLLQELHPIRNEGEYVFCLVNSLASAAELNPLCIFQEKEEVTVILPKTRADENFLLYSVICVWITLDVHSSLEAIGLTAAVAKVLTEASISCNVVAAYYHDHLFVPVKDAERAMDVLRRLSNGR